MGIKESITEFEGILWAETSLLDLGVAMMTSQGQQSVNLKLFSAEERLQQVGSAGDAGGLIQRMWD